MRGYAAAGGVGGEMEVDGVDAGVCMRGYAGVIRRYLGWGGVGGGGFR